MASSDAPEPAPWARLTGGLVGALLAGLAAPADAQVAPGGLGTQVNGSANGSCSAGACLVTGGIGAGSNGFYRFSSFDTRHGVTSVSIANPGRSTVIVGVNNRLGSFLNRPLNLSDKATLYWVSPGGIWLGQGASFASGPSYAPLESLLLTTATSINLGDGKAFDALRTSADEAAGLGGRPDPSQALTNSQASLAELDLTSPGPLVLAGGQIKVDRSLILQAPDGLVQALPGPPTSPLISSLTAGDGVQLVGRELNLENLTITAGSPGAWGAIRLETGAREGQTAAALRLAGSQLTGGFVQLRGASIAVQTSAIEAPSGLIRLESTAPASAGTINLDAVRFDLGIHNLIDLEREKQIKIPAELSGGVNIIVAATTPLIHLKAAGDVVIQASELLASQDLTPLRRDLAQRGQPPIAAEAIKLADASGNVVIEAGGAIRLAQSELRADASDNLAGNIALAARGQAGQGGLSFDAVTLSASGGAGSGDIRLSSAGGIRLRSSTLQAETNLAPSSDGLTADWSSPFLGGEITLINGSELDPIVVENSRLMAPMHSGSGLLVPGYPYDYHDDNDSFVSTIGINGDFGFFPKGQISISSHGGITINRGSVLDVSSQPPSPDGSPPAALQSFGGQINLLNWGPSPLQIDQASLLSLSDPSSAPFYNNPDAGPIPVGEPGLIQLWSNSGFNLAKGEINAGEGGFISLASLQPATISPDASLATGSDPAAASRLAIRDGLASLPPYVNQELELSDKTLERLMDQSIDVGVLPRYLTILKPDLPEEKPTVNTIAPDPISSRPVLAVEENPYQEKYVSLFSESFGADFGASFAAKPSPLQAEVSGQRLDPSASNPSAKEQQPPLTLDTNQRGAKQEEGLAGAVYSSPAPSPPISSAGPSQQPSKTLPTNLSRIDAQAASLSFSQGEERSRQDTLQGLSLSYAGGGGVPSSARLQQLLQAAEATLSSDGKAPYRPAIVRLNLSSVLAGKAQLDLLYLPPKGPIQGWRAELAEQELRGSIRSLQQQLSRMESPDLESADSAAMQLSNLLLKPLLPALRQDRITALLLSVDRGLQAIPYAALPIEPKVVFGDRYALTLTPSLGLTNLEGRISSRPGRMLLAGSSQFRNGLADLPLVRQELANLAAEHSSDLLLDQAFNERALFQKASLGKYQQVHLATHAEFSPGSPSLARIYTATGDLNLADLGRRLRQGPTGTDLDLVSLSACRTALGDAQSELGLVGLALRTGSRSALGSLWFVDDAATAAFFVAYYRQLALGLPKDEALRTTRLALRQGAIQLKGDRLIDADAKTLVSGLSAGDQLRLAKGLRHPYFWAGIVLSGSPW